MRFFEGFSDAWGGGLDASEFVGTKKVTKLQGLGGLELLQTGSDPPKAAGAAKEGTPLEELVGKTEMKVPEMNIVEEISVEFRESLLVRIALKDVVYLKTLPTKVSGDKEIEFSFRVEGTRAVKRFIMQSSRISSLGNGMFHVRTAASDEPLPMRVRLVQRHTGSLLSVMIQ